MEGQILFDFENDSSGVAGCCREHPWSQVPEGRWCCDTVSSIEGGSSLHHCYDNPEGGCDYLVLWHDPLEATDSFSFSFRIRHGFPPSSQNNWQVILGAEFLTGSDPEQDTPQLLSGIVLGVNFTGSDDLVKIWRVDHEQVEVRCATSFNYQEQVGTDQAPLFSLMGDGRGGLKLYISLNPESEEPVLLGSCELDGYAWGRQLVLRYNYTASRDRGLWLDRLNLEGHFEEDTVPPYVIHAAVFDERTLQIDFSEQLREPVPEQFRLITGTGSERAVPRALSLAGQKVKLVFDEVIPNRVPLQIRIGGMMDPDGNLSQDTVVEVMRNEAGWGDVVVNEIMADPEPPVRFGEEYLELFNRSGYPVELEGWTLQVNERTYMLNGSVPDPSGDHLELEPGGYLVLREVTLPNEGATLSLRSLEGKLIHAVSYRIPWDGPDWKKEGGWALESPDPDLICRISSNWKFSEHPEGGTPGRMNSVRENLEDRETPVMLYAGVGTPGELLLHCNEPLILTPEIPMSIHLDPGGMVPDSVRLSVPLHEVVQLHFPEDFHQWTRYSLKISGITDCEGNMSGPAELVAGTTSLPGPGSVVINEIMYDPREGYPEFVELHLPGGQVFDLQDLSVHLLDEEGTPEDPLVISVHSRLFLPGQYLVLTPSAAQLMERYGLEPGGEWVEMADWSGLNRHSGVIYLTDRSGQVLDMAVYRDEMHMELLDDSRGVSLERIAADRPGENPDSWHSAASMAGYATPGRENSQSIGAVDAEGLLEVSPEVFSPDNDGYNDVLKITLSTGSPGWVIGLLVTDLQGNRIRELANNDLAGPLQTYTWDGEGADGSLQPMGFYVIHARGYHPATGKQWIRRKGVGLLYR